MILSRYLMRSYLARFAALLVGLVVFLQTLDLLAEANTVLAGGGPPIGSLLRYVSLRAPAIAEGALMRLLCGARCFEAYRKYFNSRDPEP